MTVEKAEPRPESVTSHPATSISYEWFTAAVSEGDAEPTVDRPPSPVRLITVAAMIGAFGLTIAWIAFLAWTVSKFFKFLL
jgi:hypothetical protein